MKPSQTYLSVKALYQKWAECYDTSFNPLIEAEGKLMAGLVGEVAGKKVLDLGCGTGRHAILLAKAGASVIGVDFSEEMLALARAKARGLNATFINSELHDVPLDEKFDLVLCSLVLSHNPDLNLPMREMSRLTQEDGRIIITDLRTDYWLRKKKTIRKLGAFATDGFKHTIADYRSACVSTGLQLDKVHKIHFDDAIISRLPRFFYLKFIAVGYAFEIHKKRTDST